MAELRVAVVGVGAIGSYFAARLARVGHDVTCIARGSRLAALQATGSITVRSGDDLWRAPIQAASPATAVGPVDLLLVAVRSGQTEAALQGLGRLVGGDTLVASVQSGMECDARIRAALGHGNPVAVLPLLHCTVPAPGEVVHHAGDAVIVDAQAPPEATSALARLLHDAGLAVSVEPAARRFWTGMTYTLFNLLPVLLRVPLAGLLGDVSGTAAVDGLLAELAAVATAAGWPIAPNDLAAAREAASRRADRPGFLVAELEQGRSLELEATLGYVVAEAGRRGVPAPGLRLLYALLRAAVPAHLR